MKDVAPIVIGAGLLIGIAYVANRLLNAPALNPWLGFMHAGDSPNSGGVQQAQAFVWGPGAPAQFYNLANPRHVPVGA